MTTNVDEKHTTSNSETYATCTRHVTLPCTKLPAFHACISYTRREGVSLSCWGGWSACTSSEEQLQVAFYMQQICKDAAFLLTVGSFLLTVELFYLQLTIFAFLHTIGAFLLTILASLLTIGAFLLTVGSASNKSLKGL